jgi:hypothetical protein
MSVDRRIALNLDDLPMDVFELANQGLEVESLTAGHGMTQWRPLALLFIMSLETLDHLCGELLALRHRVYSATRAQWRFYLTSSGAESLGRLSAGSAHECCRA